MSQTQTFLVIVLTALAHPAAAVLNTLVIRRRLRGVVDQLPAGLRALAERRQAQPEDLTPPR